MSKHTTEIYIGRHGQTSGDVEGRYGGNYDDELTTLGERQSERLADEFADKGIGRLFSSERKRAKQTARIVGKKLGLHAVPMQEFNERNAYGILTGLTRDEAMANYPEQLDLVGDYRNTIEGGQPYDEFQEQVIRGLGRVSQIPGYRKVGVISHGGVIRCTFRDILKVGEVEVEDCALFKLIAQVDNRTNTIDYSFEYMSGITPKN